MVFAKENTSNATRMFFELFGSGGESNRHCRRGQEFAMPCQYRKNRPTAFLSARERYSANADNSRVDCIGIRSAAWICLAVCDANFRIRPPPLLCVGSGRSSLEEGAAGTTSFPWTEKGKVELFGVWLRHPCAPIEWETFPNGSLSYRNRSIRIIKGMLSRLIALMRDSARG